MTTRTLRPRNYSERLVKGHVVGVERLEPQRWRVTVNGRRLFTFCSESRARQAGALEAGRLALSAADACGTSAAAHVPEEPYRQPKPDMALRGEHLRLASSRRRCR